MKTMYIAVMTVLCLLAGEAFAEQGKTAPPDAYWTAVRLQQENRFNENEIRGFVYQWFSLLDKQVGVGRFLPLIVDKGLEMRFPEATLRSHADFKQWYAGILKKYKSNTHTLERIDVKVLSRGVYNVDLVVLWQAMTQNGDYVRFRAHQMWQLSDGKGARPRIINYVVEEAR